MKDQIIEQNQLNVLYFDSQKNNIFEKIDVDQEGGVDNWPSNFFDQSIKDLNYLLGI